MELPFDATDRVLVLGASGWFGRTMLDLLPPGLPVLAVAGSARAGFEPWNAERVTRFAPTVVANFAFLTRERVDVEGEERFRAVNAELTRRFLWAAGLPSVRAAVTVSSGAAVTEPELPYGEMKLAEEVSALALAGPARAVVVARAYSVSGPFVRRPHDYAFSDLILQAKSGTVLVRADRPVFRRYVSVADLLRVSVARALGGWSGVIESGGELVEVGDLAVRIVAAVRPDALLSRVAQTTSVAATYASDGVSWQVACAALEYAPADLDTQIQQASQSLIG